MISSYFIKKPIFTAVLSILVFLAGILAIRNLGIEQYPQVSPPQIVVSAVYPGASAKTLAQLVAAPIEEKINGVENMIYMNSVASDDGTVSVNIFFEVGTNVNNAKIDVNNRVQTALSSLPAIVQTLGVNVRESSPSMLEVISFYSPDKSRDSLFLSNYILLNIVDDLKRVSGVGSATIFGQKDYAIRVWIDPDKLYNLSLTTTDVIKAIKQQNEQYAAGKFSAEPISEKQMFTYTLQTPSRLSSPEEFNNIIIRASADGSTILLKDVATIELGSKNYSSKATLDGKPTIPIGINLQTGANALDTARLIENKLKELSENFPSGISYTIPYDTTSFIEISIEEVVSTFLEAILLVMVIIFVFLQNWRATFIPILAVPISIIGTFAGIYLLGFTINMLTLFGLVLAIGIVVDDAIVVIEAVEKHISEGLSVKDATYKAMHEVTGALIAIVFVLCAVFIPVAFLGGLTGVMYKQFAITIIISVVISGFVALTLTPSLCVILLKDGHQKPAGIFKWFNNMFDKLTNVYSVIVKQVIRFSLLSILLFGGLIYISYDRFLNMSTSLVPNEDQGMLMIASFNPPGASLNRTEKVATEINNIVSKDKNVDQFIQVIGMDLMTFTQSTSASLGFIKLKTWDERLLETQSAQAIANKFMKEMMATSDGFSLAIVPPPIMGLSLTGGFDLYIQDRKGQDIGVLSKYVQEILQKANARKELVGVRTTLNTYTPQYKIEVDKVKALSKGVAISEIYSTLNTTLANYNVNDFTYLGRNYKVIMEAKENYRTDPNDLNKIFVRGANNELLPISSFAKITKTTGTSIIERFNLFTSAKISGQPAIGYSSGQAQKAILEVANEVLPEGYTTGWVGTAYQEQKASSGSFIAFLSGFIILYLVLAALYERWLLPISILLSVPFSIFGAVMATELRGLENNIYFQVGLLVLMGLSAKNAVLIVEFAVQKRKEGESILDSAISAAKLRLRPIIMTSLAFTLGVVPLALSTGAGAASRQSIGTGVIGGMLAATFIAILFIPMFYVLISKITNREKKIKNLE